MKLCSIASVAIAALAVGCGIADVPRRPRPTPSTVTETSYPPRHVRLALELATEDQRRISASTPLLPSVRARHYAEHQQHRIPLPPGGNFNGIRWAQAGGPLSPGEVESSLEFNARCQWVRAALEDRVREAATVLRATTSWPALREQPLDVDRTEAARCYASHHREQQFARRHELVPSN